MPDQNHPGVHSACYQTGNGKTVLLRAAGLILLGVLLAVFCVPLWVWLTAAGIALIVLGVLLLRK